MTWNGCEANDKKCTNYKKLFVTKKNIDKGIIFWNQNKKTLLRAEKKFGVPSEIIIAIIGIESKYGSRTGTFKTFDTLFFNDIDKYGASLWYYFSNNYSK